MCDCLLHRHFVHLPTQEHLFKRKLGQKLFEGNSLLFSSDVSAFEPCNRLAKNWSTPLHLFCPAFLSLVFLFCPFVRLFTSCHFQLTHFLNRHRIHAEAQLRGKSRAKNGDIWIINLGSYLKSFPDAHSLGFTPKVQQDFKLLQSSVLSELSRQVGTSNLAMMSLLQPEEN